MRFTCIPNLGKQGGGLQWDKEENCVLATFNADGEFETEDEAVIEKLRALGYKTVQEHEVEVKSEKQAIKKKKAPPANDENFADVKARFQPQK